MRYFLDTEHTDDGERFELISIAVVCEDGREYYAAVEGYDSSAVTPWIEQHVLPKLPWVVLADPEGNEFCVLTGTSSEP